MTGRAVPPLLLLALASAGFVYVLRALARGEDLFAGIGLAATVLLLGALTRSVELLERT